MSPSRQCACVKSISNTGSIFRSISAIVYEIVGLPTDKPISAVMHAVELVEKQCTRVERTCLYNFSLYRPLVAAAGVGRQRRAIGRDRCQSEHVDQ